MQANGESWYRYEDIQYAAPVDEFDRPCGKGELLVLLREYPVLRHTPKGVWLAGTGDLRYSHHIDRFVRNDAKKRFACPTIEEAKESFIARKRRQASINHARAERAEEAIKIINRGSNEILR